ISSLMGNNISGFVIIIYLFLLIHQFIITHQLIKQRSITHPLCNIFQQNIIYGATVTTINMISNYVGIEDTAYVYVTLELIFLLSYYPCFGSNALILDNPYSYPKYL